MNEGLNGWHGLFFFCLVAGLLTIIGGVLAAAAVRLSVRDDFFQEDEKVESYS
jgi:hypothetical protein